MAGVWLARGRAEEDYGVQSTDYGFERPCVGAWLCRALLVGEDKVKPCPYLEPGQPYLETGDRIRGGLGWHAVPALPETVSAACIG